MCGAQNHVKNKKILKFKNYRKLVKIIHSCMVVECSGIWLERGKLKCVSQCVKPQLFHDIINI